MCVTLTISRSAAADCGANATPCESVTTAPAGATARWYGWQTLLMNGAWLGLGALAAAERSDEGVIGAYLGSAVGSPVLHLVHGHPTLAVGSAVAHLALPLVGLLVIVKPGVDGTGGDLPSGNLLIALSIGLPVVLDVALAWDKRDPVESRTARGSSPRSASFGWSFVPLLSRNRVGATLGGTF